MKAFVTGATGFIGSHITRELVKQGFRVRCLVRPDSNTRYIESLNLDIVKGDLWDRTFLERSMEGCDVVFHAAAMYSFWTPQPWRVYKTNVEGTSNILTAALRKGVKKVVYTSTESTIGIRGDGMGTEETLAKESDVSGHYKKSKIQAEKLALRANIMGLPVVIVNPTMPVGRFDVKPTPSGQAVLDFLNRRMPAWVETGINVVDVEDVAKGHILALDRGKAGERYILGNRNLTLKEILDMLQSLTGLKAPKMKLPLWVALGAAYMDEFARGKILNRTPGICVAAVKTAMKIRHFQCSKAIRELGLPQSPIEKAFEKAIIWFLENGYVKHRETESIAKKGNRHA